MPFRTPPWPSPVAMRVARFMIADLRRVCLRTGEAFGVSGFGSLRSLGLRQERGGASLSGCSRGFFFCFQFSCFLFSYFLVFCFLAFCFLIFLFCFLFFCFLIFSYFTYSYFVFLFHIFFFSIFFSYFALFIFPCFLRFCFLIFLFRVFFSDVTLGLILHRYTDCFFIHVIVRLCV